MNRLLRTTSVGEFIIIFRATHNLNQPELAELLGVGKTYVCTMEKGGRAKPLAIVKDLLNLQSPRLLPSERTHLVRLLIQSYAIEYEQMIAKVCKELGVNPEEILNETKKD